MKPLLKGKPKHVMTFFLAELGTSGSLDRQQRLVVKGRFAPKTLKGFSCDMSMSMLSAVVARAWIKRLDTILLKESCLFFLRYHEKLWS
ncbi:putative translation initiation factor IF2/IF5 [Helianthus annuus]|uniref:Translation initiation factor IF2/IF5 n=1 Tax=Helianthus annuus TaxID=4232 RepID=A0A9K3NMV6_HELAN|nr:eukaryotic translation initiation factor 2 subunit beta isoform X2 [Helianthus annuus]KAF5806089.1 putative translation initiation factor IF2/IF5 [Helianthus annuus]